MSGDNKMKGLLKGLRFISQIFDNNEKQPEIQIGNPTDVKHVAHIGWDGPTENSPSWMNEFKSVPGLSSSAPLNMNGNIYRKGSDDSVKWVSSDLMRRGTRFMNHEGEEDTHELPMPKSTKQHSNSTTNIRESHAKEKSDKPRQQKRPSKHSTSNESINESKHTTEQIIPMDIDSLQLQGNNNDLPPRILPEKPKRTHSKKMKDVQGGSGSSKSRSKAQHRDPNSNEGTHSRSSSKSKESNSNDEGSHSRSSSKSKESNSNDEGSHSRSSSKSKELNSNERHHSRFSSKSRDQNSNEGHSSRSRNKHRHSQEDGQHERGSNEDILRNDPN